MKKLRFSTIIWPNTAGNNVPPTLGYSTDPSTVHALYVNAALPDISGLDLV